MKAFLVANAFLISAIFGVLGSMLLGIPAVIELCFRRFNRLLVEYSDDVEGLNTDDVSLVTSRIQRTSFLIRVGKWVMLGLFSLGIAMLFLFVGLTELDW